MTEYLESKIERNTPHLIIVIPELDFSALGYDFIYLAKINQNDDDSQAVLSPPVQIADLNVSDLDLTDEEKAQFTTDTVRALLIVIPPSLTKNLKTCINYYHAMRAISPDKQTVIPFFQGQLQITQNTIKAPL